MQLFEQCPFFNLSIGSPQAMQLPKTIRFLTSTSTSVQKVKKIILFKDLYEIKGIFQSIVSN